MRYPKHAIRAGKARGLSRRAYTLVEVLVTVSIMGIAAAIVVPSMLQTGTMQIQAAGRLIIEDLLYAQNDAVGQVATRQVIFNVANNSYTLADGNGTPLQANWRMGGSSDADYVVNFNTDTRFSGCQLVAVNFGNATTLSYDVLGTPSSGGTIDIVMSNTRYRVTVAPFTGRVTIAPVPIGG